VVHNRTRPGLYATGPGPDGCFGGDLGTSLNAGTNSEEHVGIIPLKHFSEQNPARHSPYWHLPHPE
jgi:hypothetical protein